MFDFIRSHQRVMQFLLLVFIVPSFALIGVSGYNSYVSGDEEIVKVGDSAITLQEFENARANQIRQLQQFSQGNFDLDIFDDPAMRRSMLESLIDQRVIVDVATTEHFNVSDAVLRRSIAQIPQLQVDGQFSPERYSDILASMGLTTRDFESGQRAELALERVLGPITQTASVPPSVIKHIEQVLTEERTIRTSSFRSSDFIDQVNITDEQVSEWYENNQQAFQVPEHATIQYVLLNEEAAMATVPEPTDDEIKEYYEQNKARFTEPARARVSHIQIKFESNATQEQREQALQKAQEVLGMVNKNTEAFADLAKEYSQDQGTSKSGGDLGWITQGTWPANLDTAIFELDKGEVSAVVTGDDGYHIFMATEVQPEQVQSLSELHDTLYTEIRHQLGAERFADMATRLTSLVYDHPDSMEAVGQALSVKVKSADGFARNDLLSVNEVGENAASSSPDAAILGDPRVNRAVFSPQVLIEGHNSGVIEISPDTMIAVRVQELKPAFVQELDKVKPQIQSLLEIQEARKLAVSAGQKALNQLKLSPLKPYEVENSTVFDTEENTTEDQSDSTSSMLSAFGSAVTVSRLNPGNTEKPVLDASLNMGPESIPGYTGVESSHGFIVVYVESMQAGQPLEGQFDSLSADITQAWTKAEEQAVIQEMRAQAKVEYLPEASDVINNTAN